MGFHHASARLGLGCCLALAAVATLLPGHVAAADDAAAPQTLARNELQGPLLVEATAYNSVVGQTEGDPAIGAWGDRLDPGIRSVAVSNDLVELGMKRGTRVRIEGLPGEFVVLDRMPPQWQRRIDIHMGESVDVAKKWGRRKVRIYWQTP
jgi:3D (Asp-Asp-Asp) domain-containing protein